MKVLIAMLSMTISMTAMAESVYWPGAGEPAIRIQVERLFVTTPALAFNQAWENTIVDTNDPHDIPNCNQQLLVDPTHGPLIGVLRDANREGNEVSIIVEDETPASPTSFCFIRAATPRP